MTENLQTKIEHARNALDAAKRDEAAAVAYWMNTNKASQTIGSAYLRAFWAEDTLRFLTDLQKGGKND